MTRHARRLTAAVAALLALIVLAGCTVPRPPGDGPLRYRDQVFTNVTVTSNIQYGSAPHQETGNPVALRLDLYQPTGDTQAGRPAVVFVHGGGYCCGDKTAGPSADLAARFARLGYVAVSINYRLISTGCGGSNIGGACVFAAINAQHDAQAAIRWLRANAGTYRIDPTRIAIGGESAGGITATLVGTRPDDPGDSGNPGFSSAVGGFMSISGGAPGGGFAGAGDAPGLLFHGSADTVVIDDWSYDTARNLISAGVAGFYQPWEGAGHVPYLEFRDQIVTQTDYFFYFFLDLAHAQGQPPAAARAFDAQVEGLAERYPRFANQLEGRRKAYLRQYRSERRAAASAAAR